MRNSFFVTFFCLCTMSCNLGSETSIVSGNSFYANNGKGRRRIYSENEILHRTTIYPDVVSYAYNEKFIIAKQKPTKEGWLPYLSLDLYNRYIAYKEYSQNPDIFSEESWKPLKGEIEWDSSNYKIFHDREATDKNSSEDLIIGRSIADSLIKNDPYYKKIFANEVNYWIIYNPQDTLIGPLTKEEYLEKRRELNIPDELKLIE